MKKKIVVENSEVFWKCKECKRVFRTKKEALRCCPKTVVESTRWKYFKCPVCGSIYEDRYAVEECCGKEAILLNDKLVEIILTRK